jgi:hypothetical protein
VLLAGPDDLWVLFLEAALMGAGKDEIDYNCYTAIDGGLPHVCIMGLVGEFNCYGCAQSADLHRLDDWSIRGCLLPFKVCW